MVDQLVAQGACSLGLKVMDDAFQRLERVEKIDCLAPHRPFKTTKPVEGLRTERLAEYHLPAKASGSNLCSSEEFSHGIPPEGVLRQRWNLGRIAHLYVQGTPTSEKRDLVWAGSSGVIPPMLSPDCCPRYLKSGSRDSRGARVGPQSQPKIHQSTIHNTTAEYINHALFFLDRRLLGPSASPTCPYPRILSHRETIVSSKSHATVSTMLLLTHYPALRSSIRKASGVTIVMPS
jgi:hypothetical protein